MNFKFTVPYLLSGAAMVLGGGNASANATKTDSVPHTPDMLRDRIENVKSVHATDSVITDSVTRNTDAFRDGIQNIMSIAPVDSGMVDHSYAPTFAELNIELPFATTSKKIRNGMMYEFSDGSQMTRVGGTRAWRNNNPGNISRGKFAREAGAIGDDGRFAVFPDEETGMRAICKLLRTDRYNNLSIAAAVRKYAPPFENNTAAYQRRLRKMTGLALNLKISSLTDEQLQSVANAIRVVEGWKEGTEKTIVPANTREPKPDAPVNIAPNSRTMTNKMLLNLGNARGS